MRTALKYMAVGLLCLALLIPCACAPSQSEAPAPPAQSPTVSPAPEVTAPATPDKPSPSVEPAQTDAPVSQPNASGNVPAIHANEETELLYILHGVQETIPAVLHHTHHGYSIVYDAMHYDCRSQFEVDSYWSDVGLYLSVSTVYGMPLDYVLDGLQLQENIESGAQPVYIGAGLYPAYTLYHTTKDGIFRQFWALDYGSDTMLIERSYPVEHEYAEFHHAVQDAMLASLTLYDVPQTVSKGMTSTYVSVLEDLLYHCKFPDGSPTGYDGFGDLSENRFAVYDIDSDGSKELIIEYTTTITAGMQFLIYDYDEETNSLSLQFQEFPNVQIFSNGAIEAGLSHNQGLSGAFWPYTLYRYDAAADSYIPIGMVHAWDKYVKEEDFPDHIDEDGDGLVYYIIADDYDPNVPMDSAEYFAWRSSHMGAAEPLLIPYLPLTETSLAGLK